MANVVINNTKFNPFTFDEILKPLAMYAQEYKRLEDILDELGIKASVFDEMADELKDPMAYKMYKSYANALRLKLDLLNSEGLSPASRKGLLEMKSRYSKEMVPIENAYKRREALATELRLALANNPTLRYLRMANAMSLDNFINDPSIDYGYSYSGALLTKQVSDAAANLLRALLDKGKLESLGLPFQYQRMLLYGASPLLVMIAMDEQARLGDSETVRFLRGIVDLVIDSSGVASWADLKTMKEFRAFANQGLYSAIGLAKIDNFTDLYNMSLALAAAKGGGSRGGSGRSSNTEENGNPIWKLGTSLTTKEKAANIANLRVRLGFLLALKKSPNILRKITSYANAYENPFDAYYESKPSLPSAVTNTPKNTSIPKYGNMLEFALICKEYGLDIKLLVGPITKGGKKVGDQFTLRKSGGDAVNLLISTITNQLEKSIHTSNSYIGNTGNNGYIVKDILENIKVKLLTSGSSGSYKVKNGVRTDKKITLKDIDKFNSGEDSSYYTYYDDNNNPRCIIMYKDTSGKLLAIDVDLDVIGGPELLRIGLQAKTAMDNGEFNKATLYMDNIHRIIYGNAVTKANVPSNTGKANPEIPMTDEEIELLSTLYEDY